MQHGDPPAFRREPGFAGLVRIILGQQVSLTSADATYARLSALGPVTSAGFLAHDDATLRAAGFSRQKARYGRLLAERILAGALPLEDLAKLSDDDARALLVAQPGIGRWTADIYLMMALGRPDVFPVGDLALQLAAQRAKSLPERPSPAALERLSLPWSPYRAAAARLLWHAYLEAQRTRKA